jgi:hypothetical protein
MRTTQTLAVEAVLLPSVGVVERLWKTVSAEKVAPLPPPSACAGVSLEVIGFHALVPHVVELAALLREEANSSFRVLEMALATLS